MFPKDKPYINNDNMDEVRAKPCVVCGSMHGVQAHHVYPRRPRIDKIYNLLPLCINCHVQGVHGTSQEMERVKQVVSSRYKAIYKPILLMKLFDKQYKYYLLNKYREDCQNEE